MDASAAPSAALPTDYTDLPALTSTPVIADLSLTQGSALSQDKASTGGNLVEVLKQMWINERGHTTRQRHAHAGDGSTQQIEASVH